LHPSTVEVDKFGYALAFSKAMIPVIRNEEKVRKILDKSPVRRHIGLYSYTYDALKKYFEVEASPYELPEGLFIDFNRCPAIWCDFL